MGMRKISAEGQTIEKPQVAKKLPSFGAKKPPAQQAAQRQTAPTQRKTAGREPADELMEAFSGRKIPASF